MSAKLRKAGFEFDRQAKGSHEIWWNPTTRARTTLVNHPGDVPEGTLGLFETSRYQPRIIHEALRQRVIRPKEGHGVHRRGFRPFSIFVSREARARRQRPCRLIPALVSPFGIPLPRRPPDEESPKGETHPSHRWTRNRWSLFGGIGAPHGPRCALRPVGLRVTAFLIFFLPLSLATKRPRGMSDPPSQGPSHEGRGSCPPVRPGRAPLRRVIDSKKIGSERSAGVKFDL